MTEVERFNSGARYSESSVYAGTVYLAGQVASNVSKEIECQTTEILENIDRLLAEAGTSKSRILMAQIFLSDMSDYAGMNVVWDAWVDKSNTPSRATVQAKLARPEWRIEIVVTAAA
jgi:enamine deaminase RidA (YjgF/YER057c/UK114 family)